MGNKLSNIRIGAVSSSEIVALTSMSSEWRDMTPKELEAWKKDNPKSKATKMRVDSPGAPFHSYVEDCRIERFFLDEIDSTADVFSFAWGKLCELIVHEKLPRDYSFQSDVTIPHSEIDGWVGTPDGFKDIYVWKDFDGVQVGIKAVTVTDIKCPSSKRGFYNLIRDLYTFDGFTVTKKENVNGDEIIQLIRNRSKEGEKYYWQLVSNACIVDAEYAELIVYMPYYEDLDVIQAYNTELDEPFYIVNRKLNSELPYIMKETGIDDLNIIRFKVPQEDKDFLTGRVKLAIADINKE